MEDQLFERSATRPRIDFGAPMVAVASVLVVTWTSLVRRAAQRRGRVSSTVMRKTCVGRGGRCAPSGWHWYHPPNIPRRLGTLGPPLNGSANLDARGVWAVVASRGPLRGGLSLLEILCCHRLSDSLVGRRSSPHAQHLDQRQREVKDDDEPFKGTVIIQSSAKDAERP
jgi:hypothetical protein